MPNRQLSGEELSKANELLGVIRQRIMELSGGDSELRFAYNRKISKELTYDERGKPMQRRKVKMLKRAAQGGLCAQCREALPERNTVLDRFHASLGYTVENTQLICEPCDRRIQAGRRFA